MSEKSITRQRAGLLRRAKTNCRNPAISLGPALVANSFYRRGSQEKTFPHRWNFSCFQPHAIKLGVFWPAAPSARMLAVQQFRFSLSAVFIALRDEASPL